MIDELRALAIFAKVVELGSFRAAARDLKLSPSVISHHISHLEARLGTALLYRSTRKLSLTDNGITLFNSATEMLNAANTGLNQVSQASEAPSGRLSVSVPAFFTGNTVFSKIATFAKTYPKVQMVLSFTDKEQDLIGEGIDLAIRIGHLKDSSLKSKKLFDMKRCLVAAPTLIKKYPKPYHPNDLKDWDWIGLKMRPDTKTFTNPKNQTAHIDFKPRVFVDSVEALRQFALEGLGLATPPEFMVKNDLEANKLIQPLPEWDPGALPVYAVWPGNITPNGLCIKLINSLS